MKRNFYLVMKVLCKHIYYSNNITQFIALVFPESDVQDHLADNLKTYQNRGSDPFISLLDFYESLDNYHQYHFDNWLNDEMNILNRTTTQHSDITPTLY